MAANVDGGGPSLQNEVTTNAAPETGITAGELLPKSNTVRVACHFGI